MSDLMLLLSTLTQVEYNCEDPGSYAWRNCDQKRHYYNQRSIVIITDGLILRLFTNLHSVLAISINIILI